MIQRTLLLSLSIMALILAGCWDQRLLKDHSLVLTIGYDKADEEKIMSTVDFPINEGQGVQNTPPNKSKVLSVIGDTARDTEIQMDKVIPEKFDMSKTKVILFGSELATKGIFSILDFVYRDRRGPLNAMVAIIDGKAEEALISVKERDSILVSDFYSQLLQTAEQGGITKNENVQDICPVILSKGKDIVLPLMEVSKNKDEMAKIKGLALFNGDNLSGEMGIGETSMYLILSNHKQKGLSLSLKISNKKDKYDKNFVNIAVRGIDRKIKLDVKGDDVRANIDVNLKVDIDEYSANKLNTKKEADALTRKIEKELNQLAKKTIGKMQEANNDSLGLGERVRAYHYPTWKKIKWKDVYPEIPIETTFKVKIIQHGLIN